MQEYSPKINHGKRRRRERERNKAKENKTKPGSRRSVKFWMRFK
jgi:hypothetical protein